jgi:hypothetical protein
MGDIAKQPVTDRVIVGDGMEQKEGELEYWEQKRGERERKGGDEERER